MFHMTKNFNTKKLYLNLSHSSNWLHIQSVNLVLLGQCSLTVLTYNSVAICIK